MNVLLPVNRRWLVCSDSERLQLRHLHSVLLQPPAVAAYSERPPQERRMLRPPALAAYLERPPQERRRPQVCSELLQLRHLHLHSVLLRPPALAAYSERPPQERRRPQVCSDQHTIHSAIHRALGLLVSHTRYPIPCPVLRRRRRPQVLHLSSPCRAQATMRPMASTSRSLCAMARRGTARDGTRPRRRVGA